MPIDFYAPDFWVLNNFSANAVEFQGALYPTSEHAYQAAKFSSPAIRTAIRQARSPAAAKHLANVVHQAAKDPGWDANNGAKKAAVMEQILRAKLAQHPEVAAALRSSGRRRLVEGSPTDRFWGNGADGRGQNRLGRIWMHLRAELQANKA